MLRHVVFFSDDVAVRWRCHLILQKAALIIPNVCEEKSERDRMTEKTNLRCLGGMWVLQGVITPGVITSWPANYQILLTAVTAKAGFLSPQLHCIF